MITGGPGAGKTAILELASRTFSGQMVAIPESASIVYGGGFWRRPTPSAIEAAQRAIFYVQREMERLAVEERGAEVILCDRGTLDGLAYWPKAHATFFKELGTRHQKEIRRYSMVIHLRTPGEEQGYNHINPLRTETAAEAAVLDGKILKCWKGHPRRHILNGTPSFIEKAERALALIRNEISITAG